MVTIEKSIYDFIIELKRFNSKAIKTKKNYNIILINLINKTNS